MVLAPGRPEVFIWFSIICAQQRCIHPLFHFFLNFSSRGGPLLMVALAASGKWRNVKIGVGNSNTVSNSTTIILFFEN